MAARDQERVSCTGGTWTELTDADVTAITFMVVEGRVRIKWTTGSAPSDSDTGGYPYRSKEGEKNAAVTEFTQTSSADRLFAFAEGGDAVVVVDHAA